MSVPSYKNRAILLGEILTEGIRLFKKLLESEEALRQQLMKGDHRALLESEQERLEVQEEINDLEEKRKALIPTGTGVQNFITTKIEKSSQPGLLKQLAELQEVLKKIRAVHEVNQVLLTERLRFTRELQQATLESKTTYYDQKGRLSKGEGKPSKRIDRNC